GPRPALRHVLPRPLLPEHPLEDLCMLWKPKPVPAVEPVALGYIKARYLPAAGAVGRLAAPLRACAAEWEYRWGGTYLDRTETGDTLAALTRAATRDPTVALVLIPTDNHRPGDQHETRADTRRIPILTPSDNPPGMRRVSAR